MPNGHGRRNSVIEKFAYGRNTTLSRRLVDRINSHTCPKDLQPLGLAPSGSELRVPLYTVLFVSTDAFRKASNFPSFLTDTTVHRKLDLASPSNMDGHRPSSPRLLIVDLQAANTEFSRSISSCISSEASSSGLSTKNLSSSLTSSSTLSCRFTSGNSSTSICDNTNEVGSDFMVNDFPKVDKRVKRNSRRKGKKKGKQYKRVASRKVSIESSVQCNGNIYSASASETSTPSSIYSSKKHLSDNNLSDEATPHNLLGSGIILDKDNNEFVICPNLSSCTSYSPEMDDTEIVPSPERFAGDEIGCDTTTSLNSSCITDDAEAVLPFTSDGSTREDHCKENNIRDGNPSSIPISKTLKCWNSDIDENSSDDALMQLPLKEELRPSSSESKIVSPFEEIACGTLTDNTTAGLCDLDAGLCDLDAEISKDCYRNDTYLPNDDLDTCNCTERADCSNQAGCSNGFHVVVSGRRGRRARRAINNSGLNGGNRSIDANIHNHGGKDNYCSMWQKVQKFEKGCSKPNSVNVLSPHKDISTKDNRMKTKGNKFIGPRQQQSGLTYKYPCSDANSTIEGTQVVSRGSKTAKILPKSTVGNSGNGVKSKSTSIVKHAKHSHWSGPYTARTDSPNVQKHHFQPKEGPQKAPLVHLNNQNNSEVKSPRNKFSGRSLSNLTDSDLPEIEKEMQFRMEEEKESENVCDGVFHSEFSYIPTTSNQFSVGHIQASSGSDTKLFSRDTLGPSNASTEGQEFGKLDFGGHKESNNLSTIRTPMQKWVPVGRRDSSVSDAGTLDCIKILVNNKELHHPEVVEMDDLVPNSSPSLGKAIEFSYPRATESTNNLNCNHHSTEVLDSFAGIDCQTPEMKDKKFLGSETDLEKIIIAVNDACKLQTAVEDTQLMTGSMVADFENFLFSASPVIRQSEPGRTCNSCKKEQRISGSLCWHHFSDISLEKIWQWYEEPGCFGLEVKAHENCNSRRLQNSDVEFTTYFVPYLSAVQLFTMSMGSINRDLNSQVDNTENSSHSFGSLPIFSMLLPKPCDNADISLSELSSSEDFSDKIQDQEELIFEYFESDQPPRRQPLFEKIKELVTLGKLSDRRVFGDPLKLESTKLQDLHPASWYSVAWYPIYRIPEANFRASFLTYHSLGNFVCRSNPECVSDASNTLISPVVGLQTYNDKGENWFQPRDMGPNFRSEFNISGLIKERLRTLKKTASVMSKTAVAKGNNRSVNQHPDYDFFVSRS
ncbi:uncharacterized protein LOC121976589 [Zingiber officinale]|uniref:uncharacterized protein LOC121976589 n=1 Tax=Zingiber officinale TaxID=94328 RepID=UPI001C4C22C2|nr:uncharacterized protein LOC121976589 [Zingiber officinale]XP_042384746.1 uncharacterized protein LOC121976589 [Zingiber officinale]XP_042384747.1 uncharacterized protein LOC121976589 [Zingiber officinale]